MFKYVFIALFVLLGVLIIVGLSFALYRILISYETRSRADIEEKRIYLNSYGIYKYPKDNTFIWRDDNYTVVIPDKVLKKMRMNQVRYIVISKLDKDD